MCLYWIHQYISLLNTLSTYIYICLYYTHLFCLELHSILQRNSPSKSFFGDRRPLGFEKKPVESKWVCYEVTEIVLYSHICFLAKRFIVVKMCVFAYIYLYWYWCCKTKLLRKGGVYVLWKSYVLKPWKLPLYWNGEEVFHKKGSCFECLQGPLSPLQRSSSKSTPFHIKEAFRTEIKCRESSWTSNLERCLCISKSSFGVETDAFRGLGFEMVKYFGAPSSKEHNLRSGDMYI